MPTEQVRLTTDAIEVLRQYAPTQSLSNAILLMSKEVTTCNRAPQQIVTGHPSMKDDDYWARMELVCHTACRKAFTQNPPGTKRGPFEVVGPFADEGFKPATTLKKIGNIAPEDELVEPVGRQGREIR